MHNLYLCSKFLKDYCCCQSLKISSKIWHIKYCNQRYFFHLAIFNMIFLAIVFTRIKKEAFLLNFNLYFLIN